MNSGRGPLYHLTSHFTSPPHPHRPPHCRHRPAAPSSSLALRRKPGGREGHPGRQRRLPAASPRNIQRSGQVCGSPRAGTLGAAQRARGRCRRLPAPLRREARPAHRGDRGSLCLATMTRRDSTDEQQDWHLSLDHCLFSNLLTACSQA